MADSALKTAVDELKAVGTLLKSGHIAGQGVQELRDGQLKTLGGKINNFADAVQTQGDLKVAMVNIGTKGNSDTGAGQWIAPVAAQIVGLRVSSSAAITGDPTLTADKKPTGDTAVSLLASSYDMSGLSTAKQSAALTLTSTAADLVFAAGEVATFLVTNDSDDAFEDVSIMVLYKHTA